MIRIFLDETYPEKSQPLAKPIPNLKNNQSENFNFVIHGIIIKDEAKYRKILEKFHDFVEQSNFLEWIYQSKKILKYQIERSCGCSRKLYKTLSRTDAWHVPWKNFVQENTSESNTKFNLSEVIQTDNGFFNSFQDKIREFLKSISEYSEMFVISSSLEEMQKDSAKTKKAKKSKYFIGGRYQTAIMHILQNVLIKTNKIFEKFERIEIILDRTSFYNIQVQNELSLLLKYSSGLFCNIEEFLSEIKSKKTPVEKEKIFECIHEIVYSNLIKKELKAENFGKSNNFYIAKHLELKKFVADMWYYNSKNLFNIHFSAPKQNNEFLYIADWIGRFYDYSVKNKIEKLPDFIIDWSLKKIISENYSFYQKFILAILEDQLKKFLSNFYESGKEHKIFR